MEFGGTIAGLAAVDKWPDQRLLRLHLYGPYCYCLYGHGLRSHGLYSYGPYPDCLDGHGLYGHDLNSYCLYGYGPYR